MSAISWPSGRAVDRAEVRVRLKQAIHLVGSIRRAATAWHVSPQYLSAVVRGEKSIGPRVLKALKLKRRIVVVYEAR